MRTGFFNRISRIFFIQRVFFKYAIDELVFELTDSRLFNFLCRCSPDRWRHDETRQLPRAVRLRRALQDLGPVFVKFGQMLSTRRDLLPDDIANELALLQDRVPPFSSAQAQEIIEQSLGASVDELFSKFNPEPLAAASIAQVHEAVLPEGEEVVVKVLRPGIEQTIARDLSLMHMLAALVNWFWRDGKRLRPREVVTEYEKTIYDELDMQREAANATQMRKNCDDSFELYIPEVYWDYTRDKVLVLERISGIPISDIDELNRIGVNIELLAQRCVKIFFTQVFRDNFFHADMHPGNIFVSKQSPEDPHCIAVDFGIVGTLTDEDRHYLSQNLLAFFDQDYRKVAKLHVDSGWVPGDTRIEEFESSIRTVCEPIFEKPLEEISFGQVLLRLFQTARRFNMEVQPQLVLLQKTLLNIEGLGRQLYPQLDLWVTARPILKQWMNEQAGPKAIFLEIQKNLPEWGKMAPQLPGLVHQFLETGSRPSTGSLRTNQVMQSQTRSIVMAICAAALLIAGVLVALLSQSPTALFGVSVIGWCFIAAAGWCLRSALR